MYIYVLIINLDVLFGEGKKIQIYFRQKLNTDNLPVISYSSTDVNPGIEIPIFAQSRDQGILIFTNLFGKSR
jgi:hypothetical protein